MSAGTSGHGRVRVLVVDDHDLFRSGLRCLLADEGFEVADAPSGEAALARLSSFPAAVVVMDVNMPGMSGIEATRRVREQAPDASVVMLSITSDDQRVLEALRAGASGYLLKETALDDIIAGISAAAAGRTAIAPSVAAMLVAHARDTTAAPQPEPQPEPNLTRREREVLALLADGCDNAEIALRLVVSPSTAKNHVSRLLEKLGVANRVQAAVYAVQHGLIDPEGSA